MTQEGKQEIRQRILGIRRALTEETLRDNSARVAHFITGTEAWRKAETVYLYAAVRGEVRTDLLLRQSLLEGKRAAYPAVRGKDMVFLSVDEKTEFRKSAFGIPEPCGGEITEDAGLMCVPGVAFDPDGGRLGFGGGYYDRYLASHNGLVTYALAFTFQILPELPKEIHDVPVCGVVTDKGFVKGYGFYAALP